MLLAAALWAIGLWTFASRVASSTPALSPATADAIVALTGSSTLRLDAATELLEEGLGRRLLISGVNRDATREQVRATLKTAGRAFDCCVDLGFQAENTQGNARETAAWAHRHHFGRIIVVTADYHMPRAVLELHAAMPTVRLSPYPVATGTLDARRWWSRGGDARRMTVEYCKYLIILSRQALLGLRPPRTAAPDSVENGHD